MKHADTTHTIFCLTTQSLAALALAIVGSLMLGTTTAHADENMAETDYYTVAECDRNDEGKLRTCSVNQDTFVGWRTFGGSCAACHGENATGSSFAPNLVRMVDEGLSSEEFIDILKHGRADGAMPAFKENPNVFNHVESIYGYLKARSDGVVNSGRPPRIGR
jgi:cytochrome c553